MGLVTPNGLTTAASAAATRAGLARFRETEELFDKNGAPFRASFIDDELLAPLARPLARDAAVTPREQRLLRLAGMALEECLDGLADDEPPPAVLVALPERRTPAVPGLDPIDVGRFVARLAAQCGRPIDVARSEARESGRAGALAALEPALGILARGEAPLVVVGGVDSLIDSDLLEAIDGENRILTDTNGDGLIPGEAAAFVLLGPADASAQGSPPLARLVGAATDQESGHLYSEASYTGESLARAWQAMFDRLAEPVGPAATIYAGLNGEHFFSKEWGVAQLRHRERLSAETLVDHPADRLGDVGAALGAAMLGLAAVGMRAGYRRGPCLIWGASDRETRAAAMLVNWK